MKRPPIALVGDGVENPWNARALLAAAEMFGSPCLFRDRSGVARVWREALPDAEPLPTATLDEISRGYAPVVALDNLPGAPEVYGFRMPEGPRPALIVGNERRGIARDTRDVATCTVEIPMASRALNCLNVAAAAAVGLCELTRQGGAMRTSAHPGRRRPEVLLVGPAEHVELGSVIRSAGAFGWDRVLVDDRRHAWFGIERHAHAEGRAAARRRRNPIHVVLAPSGGRWSFEEVFVVTTQSAGAPLHRANLAGGPRQLIVIPDECAVDAKAEPWDRLGKVVHHAHLDLPRREFPYHYRLPATIVLAEIARQVGRPPSAARRGRQGLAYDLGLRTLIEEAGELVYPEDLAAY